jgi:hypothetical protein
LTFLIYILEALPSLFDGVVESYALDALHARVHDQRGGEHLADVLRKIIKIEGDLNCLFYVYVIVVARDIVD